jgi:hypothetical protein
VSASKPLEYRVRDYAGRLLVICSRLERAFEEADANTRHGVLPPGVWAWSPFVNGGREWCVAPARRVLTPLTERVDELCTCPRERRQVGRYVVDAPGYYKAGCDTCGTFVWWANDRKS